MCEHQAMMRPELLHNGNCLNSVSNINLIVESNLRKYSLSSFKLWNKSNTKRGILDLLDINWSVAAQNKNPNQSNTNNIQNSGIGINDQPARMHDGCIFALEIDHNAMQIAASNEQCQIFFWNLATRELIKQVKEHSEFVTSIRFFHNQPDMFYTSSLDRTIRLWKDYQSIQVYQEHQDWIRTLSLSTQDKYLISGCVSAQIFCWDPLTGQPIIKINNVSESLQSNENYLNTINCLSFSNQSEEIFVAGSRDGIAKIYDIRCNPSQLGAVQTFKVHSNKLNHINFSNDDRLLLSSGRDNSIRLWDLRFIKQNELYSNLNNTQDQYIMQYTGHKCQGYNIAAHFFGYEDLILTGSEDGYVYMYNKNSGAIEKKVQANSKVIHLVKPIPKGSQLEFVQTGLEEGCTINIWGVNQKQVINHSNLYSSDKQAGIKEEGSEQTQESINPENTDQQEDFDTVFMSDENGEEVRSQIYLSIIEELMQEYGDLILKVFHRHNFTYCANMDWQSLIQTIEEQDDQESKELLKILNDRLIRKVMEVYYEMARDPQAVREKYLFKHKSKDSQIQIKMMCSICDAMKGANESGGLERNTSQSQNPQNNHSAIKGFFNKLFGSAYMYDQREDWELERRKMHRELLSNFPSENQLQPYIDTTCLNDTEEYKSQNQHEHNKLVIHTEDEEMKEQEQEEFKESDYREQQQYEKKIIQNFTIDDERRKFIIARTTFQL
eukprot:403358022